MTLMLRSILFALMLWYAAGGAHAAPKFEPARPDRGASYDSRGDSPARLSAEDLADVARVEEYLNGIRTLRSRFFQVAPSGAQAEGSLFMARPGKLRIAYDPPVPILIVAHDKTVGYYDRELKQVQYFGSDQTPAAVLLREKIRLSGGDLAIARLERSPGALRITLVQAADPGQGALALVFADKPLALRKWTVTDAQGAVTDVALLAPEFGVALEPKLFLFDEMVEKPPAN
ncbi:MAG: outer membrane lipoprotein carrier protein LolA [Rhodospirillales bacterium]|nr:outer membrane lipoprotein carrier protein LolA [Rhodospirillales bacterium]